VDTNPLNWSAAANQRWVTVDPSSGTLAPGDATAVTVLINTNAQTLAVGAYSASVKFTNLTTTVAQQRGVTLNVQAPVVTITNAGAALLAENCGSGNGAIDPAETVTVNLGLANVGNLNAPDVVATLLATGGVTAPSGPQSYGTLLTGGQAVSNAFTFTATGTCGGPLVATLQLQSGATNLGTVAFSFRLGASSAVFSENFDGVSAPNLPPGWTASLTGAGTRWATTAAQSDTPPNAVFAPDPNSTSENWLTSPSFFLPAGGAQLSFSHAYSTESCCDAGWLQISIAGGAFIDILTAGGSFAANGYTAGNGWRGISTGYPSFITTIANLPAAAVNQNIRLRWRFTSDSSVSGLGWYVDSVSVGGGYTCCGPAITNAGSALLAENCGSGNGAIDPGETVTLNLGLANVGNIAATNVIATLLATGGVTSPSGPQSYGTLLTGGPATSNAFTFTAAGTCGGTLEATLQLQSGTKNLGTVAFSFRLGVSSAILSENFDGVTAPNLPPGWTATLTGAGTRWTTTTAQRDTPPNAVFAPDPGSTSENWLTSPSFFLPAGSRSRLRAARSPTF
jgi:hypothetical protein